MQGSFFRVHTHKDTPSTCWGEYTQYPIWSGNDLGSPGADLRYAEENGWMERIPIHIYSTFHTAFIWPMVY